MRFESLGKIFSPQDHSLPFDSTDYAQSPQALVLDDKVRVYFCTRSKQSDNMFKSHVSFVDYTKDMKTILRVEKHEVCPLGGKGELDEHGIFPISPTRVGNRVYAYTCGWSRRAAVAVETSVGLAISHDDGATFRKPFNGPVLTSSKREPFLVGDAFVREFNGQFHMWYMFGKEWKTFDAISSPDRIYKIGHAISDDGINWKKSNEGEQIISDKLHSDESMALPTVIRVKDNYLMSFCYRESYNFRTEKGRGYRLGFAVSKDLITWRRCDEEVDFLLSGESWDSDMQAYPNLFEVNGKIYLLYNGNEFGKYGFGLAILKNVDY